MSQDFNELGLSAAALEAVEALGYTAPTPVQQQAIPAVIAGRDVIAAAQTGTGKTAAFSLPTLDRIGRARHGQGPLALIVTPTRELAMQIQDVCKVVAKSTHHRVTCLVGGVSYGPQTDALKAGCDVLIATPGRLIDLMDRGVANLSQVETLVLDEADRMLDMGFLPAMKRIVAACPKQRQTLLFSATIDGGIEKNMKSLLNNPVFVEIAHKGETAKSVEQYIIPVDHRMKNDLLLALLNEKGGTRIIVFARTRHRVDTCCRKLRRAGFKAEAIHSDRSQNQRKRALDAFAESRCDVLVATDVLARGIDVSDVNYVVNLDLPTQAEDYVHRIGRTGRADKSGYAVSFVTPETKNELREVEKLIGREIPTMKLNTFDAQASEEAIAARATRKNARKDPELAQAAKEHASREKAKKKRKEAQKIEEGAPRKRQGGRSGGGQSRAKQEGGRANQSRSRNEGARSQGGRSGAKRPANGKGRVSASAPSTMRPGRAQRAARQRQHQQAVKRGSGRR